MKYDEKKKISPHPHPVGRPYLRSRRTQSLAFFWNTQLIDLRIFRCVNRHPGVTTRFSITSQVTKNAISRCFLASFCTGVEAPQVVQIRHTYRQMRLSKGYVLQQKSCRSDIVGRSYGARKGTYPLKKMGNHL